MTIISFDKLEYYLESSTYNFLNIFKNNKIITKYVFPFIKTFDKKKIDFLCKDYKFLTNYNKKLEINATNQYTVLKIDIDTSIPIHKMAKKVLKNILKTNYILVNNQIVKFKDCVILDIINTENITFNGFHTDVEYASFTGHAFNVWYLIENNENYGNMFILQSNDYKKNYTPCCIDLNNYDIKDKKIPFKEVSWFNQLINLNKNVGYLNKNNVKITYTNLKNGECIVMTKHLLHRGDHRRKNNVKGFHFRVLVKNKDGSINYDKYYKKSDSFPHHRWDQENKKLYGVKLFDFA